MLSVDPVGPGEIANLARSDGKATSFMNYEFALGRSAPKRPPATSFRE
jgi:hypothetical protein